MRIICEDQRGTTVTIDGDPLWLRSIDGIGAQYDVVTLTNSGQDGAVYGGATAKGRNIVIVIDVAMADYAAQRTALYGFFQPRSPGILYLYDEDLPGPGKKISYYVEAVTPASSDGVGHLTVSLICPDPRWYAIDEQIISLSTWEGLIEWEPELEIDEETFALTELVNTLIGNVNNPSAAAQGMTIRFAATGTVVNPSLLDVNRQEHLKLAITMTVGDVITITTEAGNKRATLISGGVSTNINNLLEYPPVWLQAYQGDNLFRYDADSGSENLLVTIRTRLAYWGA